MVRFPTATLEKCCIFFFETTNQMFDFIDEASDEDSLKTENEKKKVHKKCFPIQMQANERRLSFFYFISEGKNIVFLIFFKIYRWIFRWLTMEWYSFWNLLATSLCVSSSGNGSEFGVPAAQLLQ